MIKIWGRKDSSPVQRVLWTCTELGIPFERYDVGGKYGGNETAEFRRMNPNGRVPVIDDGGEFIWESNSIVRYLAARYGVGKLWIENPAARAHAEKWMDWSITMARNAVVDAYLGRFRGGDPALIAASLEASTAAWKSPEEVLGHSPYLAGGVFSIADISCGVLVYRHIGLDLPVPAGVRAWYDRLVERPAYREIVMIPYT